MDVAGVRGPLLPLRVAGEEFIDPFDLEGGPEWIANVADRLLSLSDFWCLRLGLLVSFREDLDLALS